MVGQGSPIAWKVFDRCAFWQIGQGFARQIFCCLAVLILTPSFSIDCFAAEKTVRLRLAWGSGSAQKQRWTGEISVNNAVLTQLQPLGVEADAPVAQRIDGSRLIVAPLEKRGFDGCDITVRADEQALVRVSLRSEQMPQAAVFEAPLSEVIASQLRGPLDQLGSFFLAHRSPGDQLRVLPTREHMVFEPGETWKLKLQPDLAAALATGPVLLDVQLRATGVAKPSWQSTQQISAATDIESGIEFEIACPASEGAYRLTVTARPEEGFATRFVPGQQAKPIATRDVEFVVIDPAAKLPVLVDQWLSVLTIDPANPRWWQRLPAWAQVPSLRGRTAGAVGNVRPVVRLTPTGELVELPPAVEGQDPYWQSYTLPIREPGKPHLVEIEVPLGVEQYLAINVIEPDAAGMVTSSQQDATLYSEERNTAGDGEVGVHRFVFWPRTRSPQLLLVNRHSAAPGQFGKIKLMKQDETAAVLAEPRIAFGGERMVAGYLAKPLLAENFGAAELLDAESGLSVQSWSTFLDGATRLAQSLRFGGYNSVMISVAADGSGLYPSRVINPSPRYDTGLLASSGQDPTRKDVLEMLLRVFDREGIRVVPTIQLAAPLPRLEALRANSDEQTIGIGCVGYNGQGWLTENLSNNGLAPFYNPLNDRVQAELAELVSELTERYGKHSSFAGVGVQLSGEGYGLLPGIAWGFDDSTAAEFAKATGVALPRQGVDRFRQRADLLLGEHRQLWTKWRTAKLSQLYTSLANQVAAQGSDAHLFMSTEELFSGPELQQRVRQTIAEPLEFRKILSDHGLDLAQLDAENSITAFIPRRLSGSAELQGQAIDLRINEAATQGELIPAQEESAVLFHRSSHRFRLPSFDEISPFGPEQTYLTVTSQPQAVGVNHRQHLAAALADDHVMTVLDGGLRLPSAADESTRVIMQTLQELPDSNAVTRTQRQQPAVMRIYRTNHATHVLLVNEAPWPVRVEVRLTASQACEWQKLGRSRLTSDSSQLAELSGALSGSEQTWQVELQAFDIQAWRFADKKLRVGELQTTLTEIAKQDLQQRIQEIESRVSNLDIERPYAQLQNPGFELEDGGVRIVGWQPRQGAAGKIGLDPTAPHSGSQALQLKSSDAVGVAVQSHLFPAPETGQLMVSVFLRAEQFKDDAQLRIAVQDQSEGRSYHQLAVISSDQLRGSGWSRYQFALNDVPFGNREQLRLHFHLTGDAEVYVDDVELYDLRFDEIQRQAIVKRLFGAKLALEHGQVVDCLHGTNDYWSRYLVEYVPSANAVSFQATKPTQATPEAVPQPIEEEESGIRSRLRNWVPSKIWR